MAKQQTENEKPEVEFLESIRHKLMLCDESKNWTVKTESLDSYMTLTIDSSRKLDQEYIELIVKTISDAELFLFEKLRQLGWCSGYNITDCRTRHLEFNWLNLRAIRPSNPSKENLIGEICSCSICRIRFDN